jgi:hypothetical protein
MTAREVHLELLLGRRVRDSRGRAAGRIEEVRADREDLDCIVREARTPWSNASRFRWCESFAAGSTGCAASRGTGSI